MKLVSFADFVKSVDESSLEPTKSEELNEDDAKKTEDDSEDEEDDPIDIELEITSKEDEEDQLEEVARPPRLTKRDRKANQVKAAATKKILGKDSPIRSQIDKIFKLVQKEIRKEASKQGVPIGNINLDKITIRR